MNLLLQDIRFGVRMALRTGKGDAMGPVLKRCLGLALVGIAIGLALFVPIGLPLDSLLFGVSGINPVARVGVGGALMPVAAMAGYLPAQRAAKVDLVAALRCE